ncbi:uncharacterized protein LOC142239623 [Haematobia irritans]|uniref:uncharacterized protein LOC142239623 n=1 Tax=Haematobia irritans TaxID=7368 RepID=UPI003F506B2D
MKSLFESIVRTTDFREENVNRLFSRLKLHDHDCSALSGFFLVPMINVEGASKRFNLVLESFTCKFFNTSDIDRLECSFGKTTKNVYVYNLNFFLDRPMSNDTEIQIKLDVTPHSSMKSIKFVDLTLNICEGLTQSHKNIIVRNLLCELRRTSNLPYACPLKANYWYKLNNVTLSPDLLPSYTPFLNFTFDFLAFRSGNLYAELQWKGVVQPK